MIYIKCIRYGNVSFSKHEGMDEATVIRLLTEIGATDIRRITEEEFKIGFSK